MNRKPCQNTVGWLSEILGLTLALAFVGMLPAQAASPEPALTRKGMTRQVASDFADDEVIRATTVETVTTFIISNEAPGHLVDYLIAQGHGNETLLQVLGYLKAQSGGVISDEWYNQVADVPLGSEVFIAQLLNYAGLNGGIEIAADGTISIPSVEGRDYDGAPGFATAPSQNGEFTFTYTQDVSHHIYTHSTDYGGGILKDYYTFGFAWRGGYTVFLPLVVRNSP
jgi:hypothetical protein